MPKRKEYIPSPQHWKDMYTHKEYGGKWMPVDKVPIEKIKFDRRLLSYPNEVDHSEVVYMLVNFDQEVWMPITVNEDFYLLDGQHRLQVARQLCLKYIDVIVQHA